jgi:hypothetical protein
VFNAESAASFIRSRVAKGTVVHADEAASWDGLHGRFEMKRINHLAAYSADGACTDQATMRAKAWRSSGKLDQPSGGYIPTEAVS